VDLLSLAQFSGSLAMFAAIRRAQMLWFFGNAQEHFEV
jgi:hypothetical protein